MTSCNNNPPTPQFRRSNFSRAPRFLSTSMDHQVALAMAITIARGTLEMITTSDNSLDNTERTSPNGSNDESERQ